MAGSIGTQAWQQQVAALIHADSAASVSNALTATIAYLVDDAHTAVVAYRADAPPQVVAHNLAPRHERHYLDRYIAGPYLLDPLYQLALSQERPDRVRFREQTPDRYRSSEYYRQYRERTHLEDEMDFFVDVDDVSVALVVAKMRGRFNRSELSRLAVAEPVLRAATERLWSHSDPNKQDSQAVTVHERLTACFDNFGQSVLTQREREITQLLLRGHSTKSIARVLEIAPGTVMVHKRNLFSKLKITSQYELFSLFIDQLSGR